MLALILALSPCPLPAAPPFRPSTPTAWYLAVGRTVPQPETAVLRFDGSATTTLFSLPASQGEIRAIDVGPAGDWHALIAEPGGGSRVVSGGATVFTLPDPAVDLAVGPDGTVHVGTQVASPTLLPGQVFASSGGPPHLVLTNPSPARPFIQLAVRADGAILAATYEPTIKVNSYQLEGSPPQFLGGYGWPRLREFRVGEDGRNDIVFEPTVGWPKNGEVYVQWPWHFEVVATQLPALGDVQGIHVTADRHVETLSHAPGGAGPVILAHDEVAFAIWPAWNRAIDLATARFDYPLPWTDLGGGLAGAFGQITPKLIADGCLAPGSDGFLQIDDVMPQAPGWLFLSLTSVPVPFKGTTMVAAPAVAQWPVMTAFNPYIHVWHWLSWPSTPAGFSFTLQAVFADPTAPAGASMTNALHVVTN